MTQLSFAQYIRKELRVFKWLALAFSTIGVGIGFGIVVLYLKANSDQVFVRSMAPYLSTLVESQDRPELMKIASFISSQRAARFVIVQDGTVLATSGSATELEMPFYESTTIGHLFGSRYTIDSLISEEVLRKENGVEINSKVILATPIRSILGSALLAALLVGIGGLALALAFARRLDRAIIKSIQPIEDLDQAIRNLENIDLESSPSSFEINELENVRRTLIQTRDNLADARDRLAESKAKELTAESYRRLLHDLHNPVAALSRMTELSLDDEQTSENREAIVRSIGSLAQEVLRQVSANRQNISDVPKVLKEDDIRTTITAATETARHANIKSKVVEFDEQLPAQKIVVAHDSEMLRRALSNLVSNAIDACASKIKIGVKNVDSEVMISVADDGPGLDTDQLTIFMQGRGRSTKADRDAIGLASVSHIVSSHGGRLIYKKSDLGGACFEVHLRGMA